MEGYKKTEPKLWTGRKSDQELYLHEKVKCIDFSIEPIDVASKKTIALLGYACDEGVRRNQGRIGAVKGPNEIRKMLAKLPNHLNKGIALMDVGTVECLDGDMESAQARLSEMVAQLLMANAFPILMGGGHDIAYGHYNGIKKYLHPKKGNKTIGIINFDAHFDLRSNTPNGRKEENNSGTPFYQIAQGCKKDGTIFNYLCLGIRKDANDKVLFQTAEEHGVSYILNERFNSNHLESVQKHIHQFISKVDHIYVTMDLDGFSSAYAPGASAASPMGFAPGIVLETLKTIIDSKKMISVDIAELNPTYDIVDQTVKLAASLLHFIIHRAALL